MTAIINVGAIGKCPSCNRKKELYKIESEEIRYDSVCGVCLLLLFKAHSVTLSNTPLFDDSERK